MDNKPQVIGITGPFGSGKSTAADFFEKKGFTKIILSKFLENELNSQGVEITRKNLQDLGDKWRKEKGSGALAIQADKHIKDNKLTKVVIDGIRNLGEVEEFRKISQFTLLGIVADRDVRFDRIKDLKEREKLNRQLFDSLDFRDLGITEDLETGLQVAKCLAISDYFLDSNSGFEKFEKDLENLLIKL